MTHKEIAERLRSMVISIEATTGEDMQRRYIQPVINPEDILSLADTIDPPKPEQGTVVWWAYSNDTGSKHLGIVADGGDGVIDYDQKFHEWLDIEYKPARILAPDEVAVKVPPVSEWPEVGGGEALCMYIWSDPGPVAWRIITRAEAERMEAER